MPGPYPAAVRAKHDAEPRAELQIGIRRRLFLMGERAACAGKCCGDLAAIDEAAALQPLQADGAVSRADAQRRASAAQFAAQVAAAKDSGDHQRKLAGDAAIAGVGFDI